MFSRLSKNAAMNAVKRLSAGATVVVTMAIAGVGAANADVVDSGIPAATPNDTELACTYDAFGINFPENASPARSSFFRYRIDGATVRDTTWFYFDGAQRWYYSNGWHSTWGYTLIEETGVHLIEAWERRYYSNGYATWAYLGSCTTASFGGSFDFDVQPFP
jgi:hypothetical protein